MAKPVEVDVPPAIVNLASGKRFAISGSTWIEVPNSITLENVDEYMVYKPRKASVLSGTRSWKVENNKGKVYTVKAKNGSWSCDCLGFTYRRKCRHVAVTKEENKAEMDAFGKDIAEP